MYTFILYGSVFFCLHEFKCNGPINCNFHGPFKNIERLFKSKDIDPPKKIDGYANPPSKIFCGSTNWSSLKGILFRHYERQSLIKWQIKDWIEWMAESRLFLKSINPRWTNWKALLCNTISDDATAVNFRNGRKFFTEITDLWKMAHSWRDKSWMRWGVLCRIRVPQSCSGRRTAGCMRGALLVLFSSKIMRTSEWVRRIRGDEPNGNSLTLPATIH